jgi:chemotaxis protein methyltransferase CheR
VKQRRPSAQQLGAFQKLITQTFGLLYDDDKLSTLEEVLMRRCQRQRSSLEDYLRRLPGEPAELRVLAQELTVGETYFFRHGEQMGAYLEEAVPRRNAVRGDRPLQVLSAGCSTGEEPYSLAILARLAGLAETETSFLGLDLNAASLQKARSGRYSLWSLRETPRELKERWFLQQGSDFVLDPSIVSSVEFRECNLLSAAPDLWQSDRFDIIFCRNMLMYFGQSQARQVVQRLVRSLAHGGYLFLGHAETLRGLSDELELFNSHHCFYYRKPPRGTRPGHSWSARTPGESSPEPLPLHCSETLDEDWMETIRAASERILRMSHAPELPSPGEAPGLHEILELQESERYGEALAALRTLPPEVKAQPETVLLEAVLLVHLSQYHLTEQLCRQLLEGAHCAAGAHYLLGLCQEGHGQQQAAVAEHRAAVRLDPSFAMPRLHLGLLARKAKDLPTARRELEQAMLLLQGESPSRLRLYGGGFGREALLDLCRSELQALPLPGAGRRRR